MKSHHQSVSFALNPSKYTFHSPASLPSFFKMDRRLVNTPKVYSDYFEFRQIGLVPAPINFLPEDCPECYICRQEYDGQEVLPVYTACGHLFCRSCILLWVQPSFDMQLHKYSFNSITCPMCRAALFTVIGPEDEDYHDMISAELEGEELSVRAMPAPYPLPAVFPRPVSHAHPIRRASFSLNPSADAFHLSVDGLAGLVPRRNTPRQYRHTSSPVPYASHLSPRLPPIMQQPSRNHSSSTVHHVSARSYSRSRTASTQTDNGQLLGRHGYVQSQMGSGQLYQSRHAERLQRALALVAESVGGFAIQGGVMLRRSNETWYQALDRWNATVAGNSEAIERH